MGPAATTVGACGFECGDAALRWPFDVPHFHTDDSDEDLILENQWSIGGQSTASPTLSGKRESCDRSATAPSPTTHSEHDHHHPSINTCNDLRENVPTCAQTQYTSTSSPEPPRVSKSPGYVHLSSIFHPSHEEKRSQSPPPTPVGRKQKGYTSSAGNQPASLRKATRSAEARMCIEEEYLAWLWRKVDITPPTLLTSR
ncbi:hypothetical protein M8818_005286 [Zalaria obscura]|uniref:Uncharacterized protein n=1 Tax=Zalaria obscura TaxID=2024903 RepID=A0ACC3SB59_9PEZI